jgi:hypothetical protein
MGQSMQCSVNDARHYLVYSDRSALLGGRVKEHGAESICRDLTSINQTLYTIPV